MSGAVFVGALQWQHDLAGAVTLEPFIGDRRAGDIAAQVLKLLALIGAPAHRRMQAKAVRVDTQFLGGRPGCARQALQAQHLLPSSWPERNTIGARRRLQRQKRGIRVRFGEVGHAPCSSMGNPWPVNNRMTCVMILSSRAYSSSMV